MGEYSKGTWKLGNNHGDVVTDCGDGFPDESGHAATDYYGGFLIAESICKKEDSQLIAAAPELLQALQDLVQLHMCEQEGLSSGQPSPTDWLRAVDQASEAIQKALG